MKTGVSGLPGNLFLQTGNICYSCYSSADWIVYSLAAGSILSECRSVVSGGGGGGKYELSTTIRPDPRAPQLPHNLFLQVKISDSCDPVILTSDHCVGGAAYIPTIFYSSILYYLYIFSLVGGNSQHTFPRTELESIWKLPKAEILNWTAWCIMNQYVYFEP